MKFDYYLREAFENKQSRTYRIVNDVLGIITVFAVVVVAIESVESVYRQYTSFFTIIEWVVVAIFTIEYIIYIYLAPNKKKYLTSFFGIIDLLAILPAYLGLILVPFTELKELRVLRIVRVLRLLRILRLLKVVAYSRRRHPDGKMHFRDFPWYNMEIYFLALFSVSVVSGTLMHLAEGGVAGTPFTNIPQGIWWALVTLTTVGYGDMVPQTILGRIVAALTMISGLMLLAMLVSVVGRIMQKILFGTTLEVIQKE